MEPMLSAISESGIPKGDSWAHEPKWDGFRTLVFRDGDEVALVSRGGRPMTRYFPEVLPAFRKLPASKLVLDGELVVVGATARVVRRFRHRGGGRRGPAARAARREAQAAGEAAQGCEAADLSHALHARPQDGPEVVREVRGGRT